MRLTKRTGSGLAVINRAAFPDYAQETLIHEMCAFSPWRKVVDKLCDYEEGEDGHNVKSTMHNA
ncbi:MAG: hypothetical protein IJH94_03480 [Clostridia bacterium]|nr:hypothetical protein [Clostridia bacterium]